MKFFEGSALNEIMWKTVVEPGTPLDYNIIRRREDAISCLTPDN